MLLSFALILSLFPHFSNLRKKARKCIYDLKLIQIKACNCKVTKYEMNFWKRLLNLKKPYTYGIIQSIKSLSAEIWNKFWTHQTEMQNTILWIHMPVKLDRIHLLEIKPSSLKEWLFPAFPAHFFKTSVFPAFPASLTL